MNPLHPHTGLELTDAQVERLAQYRTIRRNAKKAARSGNPAKRAPAQSVLRRLPDAIASVYATGA